jgi:hypothetical protein
MELQFNKSKMRRIVKQFVEHFFAYLDRMMHI